MYNLLNLIRRFISPPHFQDEEQTRLARIVHVLYIAIVLASVIAAAADRTRLSTAEIILTGNVFLLFAYWLNVRGQPRIAGFVMLVLLLGVVIALLLIGNGIHDIAITALPLLLIMSALILERRGVILFVMIVIGATGFVVYADMAKLPWFDIQFPTATSASDFFIVATILGIATVSTHLLIDELVRGLNHTKYSEARVRALVENSPDFILEINRNGQILFINRFSERYVGKNVREVLPADQIESALNIIEKAFKSGEPQSVELQTIAPDGRITWDSLRIGPVKQGNQITSLTIIMSEITNQKDVEAALRESEERYRNAITAAGMVPYVIDYPSGSFTFIGADIFKLTGYTMEEFTPALLKASVLEDYISGANANLSPDEARQQFRAGKILEWHSDMRIRTRNGDLWLTDSSIELRDETGKAKGAVGIFQDISERKRAEKERERLFKELETQNTELERFNYTISHELKSPLVTIKGFVGSVEKDLHNENIEKAKKDLQRIASAADKMQDTLSDLLELSRIGHVVHPAEEINLNELTKEVLQGMDGLIQAGNITVKVSDKLPKVTADRARLREVFENLINNAIKYMSNQKNPLIEIGLRSEGDEQILFIKDNGIGIAPQYQSKVFGLFEKLNPSSEGTGVGLTLIKRIIEIQGGRIWVESQGLGNGSTFCFTIPEGIKKGH